MKISLPHNFACIKVKNISANFTAIHLEKERGEEKEERRIIETRLLLI